MTLFLVTNIAEAVHDGLHNYVKVGKSFVYSNRPIEYMEENGMRVGVALDGFILPRISNSDEYLDMSTERLIAALYKKFGLKFIDNIKGNFLLLLVLDNESYIFNDRIGINKFYYHQDGDRYLVTNRLVFITKNIKAEVDKEVIAVSMLMNHFIDGYTFLKGVYFSSPACRIKIDREMKIETYWDCNELLSLEHNHMTYRHFAHEFQRILKSYIDIFEPKKIALTLTGGLDSRTILAGLLSLDIEPICITYGNPLSPDVINAEELSRINGLVHYNCYKVPTAEWFYLIAREITDIGNSICQIHRAHRLDAVKDMSSAFPTIDMLIGGYMGGEAIRGIYYDDLIISEFARKFFCGNSDNIGIVRAHLKKRFLLEEHLDVNRILEILRRMRYFGEEKSKNEFYLLWLMEATLHQAQDPNLFSQYVNYTVPIFMDIDFLYLLYGSNYSFLGGNIEVFNRISSIKGGQELNCNVINILAPELSDIPFAKKGYYSVNELLGNRIEFWRKRVWRYLWQKKHLGNFKLSNWMPEFVGSRLETLETNPITGEIFNIGRLKSEFQRSQHKPAERYWRKYTDIIALDLMIAHYLRSGGN